eukprot:CAMPEP_0172684370 /NCGR_PEP_ID=MMETSP1074-20121228/19511_1 /TAXON_ID=2916 /ORGANISM="Ceratium fusus, Strain PA161109" /LENGTH=146 /DNA_ID=CAMNT_0013503371 /DNA_START=33 /DNA_END=474 /DNA_ORIENTATION=+
MEQSGTLLTSTNGKPLSALVPGFPGVKFSLVHTLHLVCLAATLDIHEGRHARHIMLLASFLHSVIVDVDVAEEDFVSSSSAAALYFGPKVLQGGHHTAENNITTGISPPITSRYSSIVPSTFCGMAELFTRDFNPDACCAHDKNER